MGAIAKKADMLGVPVTGVIPQALVPLTGPLIGQTITVSDMHTRKLKMNRLADAFIGLPGGFGTVEELFEMITWLQLGIHEKPVALLNVNGYFDHIVKWIDHAVAESFISENHRQCVIVETDPVELLNKVTDFEKKHVPVVDSAQKWQLKEYEV